MLFSRSQPSPDTHTGQIHNRERDKYNEKASLLPAVHSYQNRKKIKTDDERRRRHHSQRRPSSSNYERQTKPEPPVKTTEQLLKEEIEKLQNEAYQNQVTRAGQDAMLSKVREQLAESTRARARDAEFAKSHAIKLTEDLKLRDAEIHNLKLEINNAQAQALNLRMREIEIRDLKRDLKAQQELALARGRQIRRTHEVHEGELLRIRQSMVSLESSYDVLIQQSILDRDAAQKRYADLEENWHAIPSVLEAMKVGMALQDQLAKHHVFHADIRKIVGLDHYRIMLCQLDGYPFKVPLILPQVSSWLHPPKTCLICANDYHDPVIVSREEWQRACCGFEGPWTKDIFSFPSVEDLSCDHPMDVCKACMKDQIHSQLDTQGRKSWNELSCPLCSRVLHHKEIHTFASDEDFARYERYYLLEYLSTQPGFVWCLSGRCDGGQIHDDNARRIACESCHFEMCFQHKVPWHTNLTCAQYDHKLAHAEDEEKSEAWKKQNTKNCPGQNCSRPIQKGEGCFHMTCRECKHEFCWECLADWAAIKSNKLNHKEGCYFRTSTVGPMGMRGARLDAAVMN